MASLFKWIENIQEKEWNYYAGYRKHPIVKPLSGKNSSVNFINQYFKQGGKEAITDAFNLEHFGIQRADHTVSIFFFGLILFHNSIFSKRTFFAGIESQHYDFFQFIWFVTCLSHDAAFYKEHDKGLLLACPDIGSLKHHLHITHDLTLQEVENVPKDMFELCEKYYTYRHQHKKYPATDHGIYAGLLMYDCLVKNRRLKNSMNDSLLLWEEWLEPQYAFAAATVAVHNIWFPKKQDELIYNDNGLSVLIGKKPITFTQGPLLFLLGLVDTIDPVKAYKNEDLACAEILKNVFLTFQGKNTFKFIISKKMKFEIFAQRADSLNAWLDVNIRKKERTIWVTIPIT